MKTITALFVFALVVSSKTEAQTMLRLSDFGAIVNTDTYAAAKINTKALQAAVEVAHTLPTLGGILVDGIYFYNIPESGNGTIKWRSGVNLIGYSPETSKLKMYSGDTTRTHFIDCIGSDNVRFQNLTLDGNKGSTIHHPDEQAHCILMTDTTSENWTFDNVHFVNHRRDGVKMLGCKNIRYDNCSFDGCQRASLVFQRYVEGVWVTNTNFNNCGDGCIDFEPTGTSGSPEDVFITNCRFGSIRQGNSAINISGNGTNSRADGVRIHGCEFLNGGISGQSFSNAVISNNVFKFSSTITGEPPFRWFKNVSNLRFVNNTVYCGNVMTDVIIIHKQISKPEETIFIYGNTFLDVKKRLVFAENTDGFEFTDNKVVADNSNTSKLIHVTSPIDSINGLVKVSDNQFNCTGCVNVSFITRANLPIKAVMVNNNLFRGGTIGLEVRGVAESYGFVAICNNHMVGVTTPYELINGVDYKRCK